MTQLRISRYKVITCQAKTKKRLRIMWSEGEEDDISDGELMDLSELVQGILSSEGVTLKEKAESSEAIPDLPRRPRASQVDVYPQLHNGPLAIPKDKWDDLQSLKPCLPKESWNFYDNLPHQSESIRKAKRESKKPQRKD
ncbi:hypothetical protein GE061_000199 [Apolygus lucorum]|uniref:Uncharacterized protein n=1 Tax=Apolygus lucorum TaxID=248454 RepID=A0A8S9Y4X1_APOLU|nr:hypothetical protein GE061_000199 [Apolygus lucorum]